MVSSVVSFSWHFFIYNQLNLLSRDQPPHTLGKERLVTHDALLGPNTFVVSILRSIRLQMFIPITLHVHPLPACDCP